MFLFVCFVYVIFSSGHYDFHFQAAAAAFFWISYFVCNVFFLESNALTSSCAVWKIKSEMEESEEEKRERARAA